MTNPQSPPTPPSPQEALAAMQSQTIDAIRTGQAQTLGALKNWNASMSRFAPSTPQPPPEVQEALGDPAEVVDSVYDFAAQLLELNKQFVHELLIASRTDK